MENNLVFYSCVVALNFAKYKVKINLYFCNSQLRGSFFFSFTSDKKFGMHLSCSIFSTLLHFPVLFIHTGAVSPLPLCIFFFFTIKSSLRIDLAACTQPPNKPAEHCVCGHWQPSGFNYCSVFLQPPLPTPTCYIPKAAQHPSWKCVWIIPSCSSQPMADGRWYRNVPALLSLLFQNSWACNLQFVKISRWIKLWSPSW